MRPRRMYSNPLLPVNSKQLKGRPNQVNSFLRLILLAAFLLIASYAFVTYRGSSHKQGSAAARTTAESDSVSPPNTHTVDQTSKDGSSLKAEHYPDATHQLSMKQHHLNQHKEPDVSTGTVSADVPSSTTTAHEAEHHEVQVAVHHGAVTVGDASTAHPQGSQEPETVVVHHGSVEAVHGGQEAHGGAVTAEQQHQQANSLYELSAEDIDGQVRQLSEYKGQVALVVNVASACGYTDENYKGLEELYLRYRSRGLTILGFPCNQFGQQESGTLQEIKHFCTSRYHVTFPMFAKVEVNGPNTHPVYRFLKTHLPSSALGGEAVGPEGKELVWNFNKFLVDKQGQPVHFFYQRFDRQELESAIERLLPEGLPL